MDDDPGQDDRRRNAGRKGGRGPGKREPEAAADDYTEQERAGFGTWVELGARDPDQQWIVDGSLSVRWERRDPSGSEWVQELLMDPRRVLMEAKVPGVHPRSRITTTILHHHRGLRKKIIVTTATVEEQTGDVSLVIDKETVNSD